MKRKKHHKPIRSGQADRHVRLHHWLLGSPAWKSLDPYARALLVGLYGLYNGRNNGEIVCSVREGAEIIGCATGTAEKAFVALQRRGFLRIKRKGNRTRRDEGKIASTWLLSEFADDLNDRPPTKEFMRWRTVADDIPVRWRGDSRNSAPQKNSTVSPRETDRRTTYDGTPNESAKNGHDRTTTYDGQAESETATVSPRKTHIVNHPKGALRAAGTQAARPKGGVVGVPEGDPGCRSAEGSPNFGDSAGGPTKADWAELRRAMVAGGMRVKGHAAAHRGPPTVASERKRKGGGWFGARGACEHFPAPERRALGLTQEQLATRAGVQRAYLATLERGKRKPGPAIRARLEEALSGRTVVA